MKKNLLTLGIMFSAALIVAQTPRLSLFEEFTGENCPPCASTNPGLNIKLASPTNSPLVVAIKWQVPIPSAPSNTWSLYKTYKADIDWRHYGWNGGYSSTVLNPPAVAGYGYPGQFTPTTTAKSGISSAPTGLFDGQHAWTFGAASDHPLYVTDAVIASAQAKVSAFSIIMKREWNGPQTALNVTVHIMASMNFTATGALVFRAVMVERLIQFSVAPGTNGEKNFEDVAIASFPSIQAGTPMASVWKLGDIQTFTLNCPVPLYTRDKNQVTMTGFIQDDGTRKVAQAVRSKTCTEQGVTITSPKNSICKGEFVTLTANNATAFKWNKGQMLNLISVNPSVTTTYYVESTDAGACGNFAAFTVTVSACTGLNPDGSIVQHEIYPNPNQGEFVIKGNFANEKAQLVIFNAIGQKVFEQPLGSDETSIKTDLPKGLYHYQIINSDNGKENAGTGKLIVR